MKQSESSTAGFVPPCEGEDRTLFESIASFRSDEARQAAIKCVSCLLIQNCRRDLADPSKFSQLNLPTVRSGVYVNANNTRRVVDLFEGDRRPFTDSRLSYDRFIDSDDPGELVAGLRKLLGEEEISLRGGKGEDRKAELIGIDLWEIDTEGEAKLRHFKALYQARDKGFLLGNPLVAYEQTIGTVLEDYRKLSEATDEVTAAAVVGYFNLEDLSELFSLADADDNVPSWMIKRFLHANRRNPQAALDRYLENCGRLSSSPSAEGIPPNILRRLVLENTNDPDGALAAFNVRLAELTDHVHNHQAVNPNTLRYIALNNSRSAMATLLRFEKLYEDLMAKYGDLGLDPTTARLFALQFPNQAHNKAAKFTQDFTELKEQFTTNPALDEGILRKFSRLYDSPERAIATYIDNINRLTEQYPDMPTGVIRAVSRKLHSSNDAAAEVDRVKRELAEEYLGNPLVTDKVLDTIALNSIAYWHKGSASEEIELFLKNLEELQTKFDRYHIDIDTLSGVALYHPGKPEKAMTRLLRLLGIVSKPKTRPLSLDARIWGSSDSDASVDLIKGGISAEDEFFRIYNRENLVTRVGGILSTLDDEAREQVEIYFGFKDSPDGSVPNDQDIDVILESLRSK